MLIAFLSLTIIILLACLGLAGYYIWKFATIIMVFEDDLEESLESMNSIDKSMKGLLEMQMFFDSPEIKNAVKGVLEEVTLTRAVLNLTIKKFTDRSKQKYITVWDEEEEEKEDRDEEELSQQELEEARMFLEQQRQQNDDTMFGSVNGQQQPMGRQRGTLLSVGGRTVTRR